MSEDKIEYDIRPGSTVKLKRIDPLEIIANQLISINTHLAGIAGNILYLTEQFKKDQEE